MAIRARLGNLPGEFSCDPRLTGRELIGYLAELRGMRRLGRAEQLAERFAADLDRPTGELSRGNRQKIGIVQAAFREPELLVLDEPTGGLDPIMQEEFLAFVADEHERGTTVFLSSHDLDEVERACDRVGIVRDGHHAAVERVSEMTGRSYRHVTLEFAGPVDAGEFRRIPGVRNVRHGGNHVSFEAEGDLDDVIKAAARDTVVDIELTRPSLEEVFLTYYTEDAAIWPSIQGSIDELLRHYPPALKDAFGITELRSVEAYIDAEMLSIIIPFAVAVLGVRAITRVVTTPEEQGWLDTVLAAPVRRRTLATGAVLVAAVVVAEVLAVITAMTWVAGALAGADPSLIVLVRGLANEWPLALLFAGLAALVAGCAHRSAPVTAIASGTLVAMYVLDLVGKLAGGVSWLRWASAFRYTGSAIRDRIDPVAFAGMALVAAALAVAGAALLERRDIL